ncbi:tryptophan--tRNA ligase, partial [bacterium]|nr:tryptophan--tRNA ligase [bacterium]
VPGEKNKEIKSACKDASIGCVECKKRLAEEINSLLAPIKERRKKISGDEVNKALEEGAKKAGAAAAETLQSVRKSISI